MGKEKGWGHLLVLKSQVLEELFLTPYAPQPPVYILRFLSMCAFWGHSSLFHLWPNVKFLSQNGTQASYLGSLWSIWSDILLRHHSSRFLWSPRTVVTEEVCRTPCSPVSPNSLQLHRLPGPAFEVGSKSVLSDLLTALIATSLSLSSSLSAQPSAQRTLHCALDRKTERRPSSVLTLDIFPQRHFHFLCLHTFPLCPCPIWDVSSLLPPGSGFRNMKPVTGRLPCP